MPDGQTGDSSPKFDAGAVPASGGPQDSEMFVRVYQYSADSSWNKTDMIGVPVSMWRQLYPEDVSGDGDRPVFVSLGLGTVVGRVRPDSALDWEPGRVEIPEWMWLLLGAPDTGAPMEMEPIALHDVGRIVLRPRTVAAAEAGEAALTAELSAGSWAVLQSNMELTLACGIYDVLEVFDVTGGDVLAGCILNQDVTVEFEPVLGVTPPSPIPPMIPSVPAPPPAPARTGGAGVSAQPQPTRSGFISFSGKGYTLGSI